MLSKKPFRQTLMVLLTIAVSFMWLPSQALAVAIFNLEASDFVEITGISTIDNGASGLIDPAAWLDYIITSVEDAELDVNADFEPSTNSAEASGALAYSATSWDASVTATGTASVPGYAQADALALLDVEIQNASSVVLDISMERSHGYSVEFFLGSKFDSLEILNITSDGFGLSLVQPLHGPDSVNFNESFGPNAFSTTLNPGGIYGFTVFASAEGLVATAIPEPSSLLLLGTGLIGLVGIARRRKG